VLIALSDTKVFNIIVESFDEVLLFPRGFTEIPLSNFKNITVSSALIGCIVLGLFGGFVSQKIGRKVK
jgi:SP family xylose:H+ symportor-like MFS transporter